jgi:predicted dehydrogenase
MGGRWRTVLVGCGKIGVGYADDRVMARHYKYTTHAQVLAVHPGFEWYAAVDTNPEAVRHTAGRWNVKGATSIATLPDLTTIEIAVLAVPPGQRLSILDSMPNLRAVVVEKPLGATATEAEEFVAICERRRIEVQVNLPRRCDGTHRNLAAGGLFQRIGRPQGATLVYGNGLMNNGTHMIDLTRMLLDEVVEVTPASCRPYREGPIEADTNVAFVLRLKSGIAVFGLPVSYAHYRELTLDVWGERGRLSLSQEGLCLTTWPIAPHRAMQDEREIVTDAPTVEITTIGDAQRSVYDDLEDALTVGRTPASSGRSALQTARVVDAVKRAMACGAPVSL